MRRNRFFGKFSKVAFGIALLMIVGAVPLTQPVKTEAAHKNDVHPCKAYCYSDLTDRVKEQKLEDKLKKLGYSFDKKHGGRKLVFGTDKDNKKWDLKEEVYFPHDYKTYRYYFYVQTQTTYTASSKEDGHYVERGKSTKTHWHTEKFSLSGKQVKAYVDSSGYHGFDSSSISLKSRAEEPRCEQDVGETFYGFCSDVGSRFEGKLKDQSCLYVVDLKPIRHFEADTSDVITLGGSTITYTDSKGQKYKLSGVSLRKHDDYGDGKSIAKTYNRQELENFSKKYYSGVTSHMHSSPEKNATSYDSFTGSWSADGLCHIVWKNDKFKKTHTNFKNGKSFTNQGIKGECSYATWKKYLTKKLYIPLSYASISDGDSVDLILTYKPVETESVRVVKELYAPNVNGEYKLRKTTSYAKTQMKVSGFNTEGTPFTHINFGNFKLAW